MINPRENILSKKRGSSAASPVASARVSHVFPDLGEIPEAQALVDS